jgi:hypothetical protein
LYNCLRQDKLGSAVLILNNNLNKKGDSDVADPLEVSLRPNPQTASDWEDSGATEKDFLKKASNYEQAAGLRRMAGELKEAATDRELAGHAFVDGPKKNYAAAASNFAIAGQNREEAGNAAKLNKNFKEAADQFSAAARDMKAAANYARNAGDRPNAEADLRDARKFEVLAKDSLAQLKLQQGKKH